MAALRASSRQDVTLENLIGAMVDGARNTLAVAVACASAGVVIAVVTLSGLGIVFTQFVVHLAKDMLLVALILTMIAGIVLGMGIPTTPAYIIMTALLVPAIIKLGVIEPAAHMFAFYFAILSAITPPVALAVFAACGIAKSDLWSSGWAAVKIGAAGFIVPFMFVYEPALLMIGPWPQVVWSRHHCHHRCGAVLRRAQFVSGDARPAMAAHRTDRRGIAADQAGARIRSRRRRSRRPGDRGAARDAARGGGRNRQTGVAIDEFP